MCSANSEEQLELLRIASHCTVKSPTAVSNTRKLVLLVSEEGEVEQLIQMWAGSFKYKLCTEHLIYYAASSDLMYLLCAEELTKYAESSNNHVLTLR